MGHFYGPWLDPTQRGKKTSGNLGSSGFTNLEANPIINLVKQAIHFLLCKPFTTLTTTGILSNTALQLSV